MEEEERKREREVEEEGRWGMVYDEIIRLRGNMRDSSVEVIHYFR